MKVCAKCGGQFDGIECPPCKKVRNLKWYHENKNRPGYREGRAEYRKNNKQKIAAARSRTYQEKIKPQLARLQFASHLEVGTETVRLDKHTKRPRMWVKTAEPNKWRPRSIVAFEKEHGPIPRGMVIHHKDHDSLNDAPHNLVALTRAEHALEHSGAYWGANAHLKLETTTRNRVA